MSRSGKVEINQVTKMLKMRKVEKIVSKTQSKSITLNLERVACTGKAPGLLGRPKVSPSRLLINQKLQYSYLIFPSYIKKWRAFVSPILIWCHRFVLTASGKSEAGWMKRNRADVRRVTPQHLGAAGDPESCCAFLSFILPWFYFQELSLSFHKNSSFESASYSSLQYTFIG